MAAARRREPPMNETVLPRGDDPPNPPAPPGGGKTEHLIGLLLGTEEDWPRAFDEILRRVGPVRGAGGTRHSFACERVSIEPFGLRDRPRYDLAIDRLAYWYYHP